MMNKIIYLKTYLVKEVESKWDFKYYYNVWILRNLNGKTGLVTERKTISDRKSNLEKDSRTRTRQQYKLIFLEYIVDSVVWWSMDERDERDDFNETEVPNIRIKVCLVFTLFVRMWLWNTSFSPCPCPSQSTLYFPLF